MLDIFDSGEGVIEDKIINNSRWSIQYRLVFKMQAKIYIAYYSRGATEYQAESPWEYDDTVNCYEAREIQVTDYEEI